MHALLSWATTLVFLPVFGLILLVFDPAQRVARLFGQRPQEHVAGALQWSLVQAWRICGTRLVVERSPKMRPWHQYIIVSNHQSMFDIALIGAVFYSNFPKYVSKRSLGKWIPSISYNLRQGGHVLIDRGDPETALAAIRELGRRVARGHGSAMIFPEGTRARHGELKPFKPGGTMALLEEAPHVPVVPLAIDGSWKVLLHNYFPVPFGTTVRVHIGDPIPRHPGEDGVEILARVRSEIDATLHRWRGTTG